MAKIATKWINENGFDIATSGNDGFSLLLETNDNLLTETSFNLLLEPTVITPKKPANWSEA